MKKRLARVRNQSDRRFRPAQARQDRLEDKIAESSLVDRTCDRDQKVIASPEKSSSLKHDRQIRCHLLPPATGKERDPRPMRMRTGLRMVGIRTHVDYGVLFAF